MQNLSRRIWHRMTKPIYLASIAMKADAFLVSYPKSGRTWFRFVLSNYFAHAFNLDTDVDLHSMFKIMPNFDGDPVRGIPAFAFGKVSAGVAVDPGKPSGFSKTALSEPARHHHGARPAGRDRLQLFSRHAPEAQFSRRYRSSS